MRKNFLSIESVFDRVSHVYDFPLVQAAFYRRIQSALLKAIIDEEPETILDAGCGTGQLLQRMSDTWPSANLIGIDISEKMLDKAREKNYPLSMPQFHQSSVYEIPVESHSVDLITSTISSHFYLEIEAALDEFYRLLKADGKLVMANLTNGLAGYIPSPFQREVRTPNQCYRSKQSWLDLFEMKGFHVLSDQALVYPAHLFVCQK